MRSGERAAATEFIQRDPNRGLHEQRRATPAAQKETLTTGATEVYLTLFI
jgi:hypothetical protein